ncbi:hypothetical protein TNCV_2603731 [Trichonephila clavipes]|nr:hypothetical protein TNCV_2603731 [Trichonephila clavipes]
MALHWSPNILCYAIGSFGYSSNSDLHLSQVESHIQDSSNVTIKSNRGSINREIGVAKGLVYHAQSLAPQTWHSEILIQSPPPFGIVRTRRDWIATEWNIHDESRFNLGSNGNRVRVWRPHIKSLNSAYAVQRHTAPTTGVWYGVPLHTMHGHL